MDEPRAARSRKQVPRLTLSPLTGAIYIVTRYRERDNGIVEALEKYDVTNDFLALYDEATSKFTYTETTGKGVAASEPTNQLGRAAPSIRLLTPRT